MGIRKQTEPIFIIELFGYNWYSFPRSPRGGVAVATAEQIKRFEALTMGPGGCGIPHPSRWPLGATVAGMTASVRVGVARRAEQDTRGEIGSARNAALRKVDGVRGAEPHSLVAPVEVHKATGESRQEDGGRITQEQVMDNFNRLLEKWLEENPEGG